MQINKSHHVFNLIIFLGLFSILPVFSYSQNPGGMRGFFQTINRRVSPAIVDIKAIPMFPMGQMFPNINEEPSKDNRNNDETNSSENNTDMNKFIRKYIPKNMPIPFGGITGGTGIIIRRDGYILTAAHIVKNAREIKVEYTAARGMSKEYMVPGKTVFTAMIVKSDSQLDIALLKIKGANFPLVELGDSDNLENQQSIAVVGYPVNQESSDSPTISFGQITKTHEKVPEVIDVELLMFDARISKGYGGGALVNPRGQVIGLIVAKSNESDESFGYAIPINRIKPIIDKWVHLNQQENVSSKGWLGVYLTDLDEQLSLSLGLPSDQQGTVVAKVIDNSPAAKAGIREHDVIIGYNQKGVNNGNQLRRFISETLVGEKVILHVLRKENELSITVRIEPNIDTTIESQKASEKSGKLVIKIDSDGIFIEGKRVSIKNINNVLKDLISKETYVIIISSVGTDSEDMAKVIEMCQGLGVKNITIQNSN